MKSIGYRPQFAGAVEACASSGGQYMPPILVAAAFIMAEIVGVSYATIAMSAFLSAVIYYVGVYAVVHFEAQKEGLEGLPPDQIPRLRKAMKKGYLILPVIGIVYLLVAGYSALMAAFWACVLAVGSSYLGKESRMKISPFLKALSKGANNSIMLAVSCAASGIIVSVVTHSAWESPLPARSFPSPGNPHHRSHSGDDRLPDPGHGAAEHGRLHPGGGPDGAGHREDGGGHRRRPSLRLLLRQHLLHHPAGGGLLLRRGFHCRSDPMKTGWEATKLASPGISFPSCSSTPRPWF